MQEFEIQSVKQNLHVRIVMKYGSAYNTQSWYYNWMVSLEDKLTDLNS